MRSRRSCGSLPLCIDNIYKLAQPNLFTKNNIFQSESDQQPAVEDYKQNRYRVEDDVRFVDRWRPQDVAIAVQQYGRKDGSEHSEEVEAIESKY